jgi:hypothetical protein
MAAMYMLACVTGVLLRSKHELNALALISYAP